MPDPPHIVIAGSGPAGTATALGLQRMGFDVTVVTSPRVFVACEGISDRVLQGLHNAGIRQALETIAAPSRRRASWNGTTTEANTERLIRRDRFDQALIADLEQAHIRVIRGRVGQVQTVDGAVSLGGTNESGEAFCLSALFFVDARGRSAPAGRQARMRGPATVSLLQTWQGGTCEAQSAAISFADGWAWVARCCDGSRYTQLTLSADAIPPRPLLADFFYPRLQNIPEATAFFDGASPVGDIHARSATAILHCDPLDQRVIRVGDAALTVDPLSGNGIFQSLSTALLAPRIINTILHKADRAGLARQFYRERVNHAFMRSARLGRDFYQQESRWLQQPFWQQRRHWPDQQPMHEPASPGQLTVARRAVVSGDFISEADVVLTPDQPLGIWHLQGIELAPVVRRLRERQAQAQPLQTPQELRDFVQDFLQQHRPDASPQQLRRLTGWLQEHQLLS